jgi:hypothetical protein
VNRSHLAIATNQLSQLVCATMLAASANVFAQSDNPAENKAFVQKWIADMTDYIDAKCSDFKPAIAFNDAGIDYAQNPSLGTPTAIDRITAPLSGIATVCEMGDAPANALKKKFSAVQLKQGAANAVRLNGKTLELTFASRSSEPFGRLKEFFAGKIRQL